MGRRSTLPVPHCTHWPQRTSAPHEWLHTRFFGYNRRFLARDSSVSSYINWCYSFCWSYVYFNNSIWDSSKAFAWSRNFLHEYWFLCFLSGNSHISCSQNKWSPWTNGKVEIHNKHLSSYFRCYLSEAGTIWAKLSCQFAFAQYISVNSGTGTTSFEIVFGFNPQITNSLKMGLVRDDSDLC